MIAWGCCFDSGPADRSTTRQGPLSYNDTMRDSTIHWMEELPGYQPWPPADELESVFSFPVALDGGGKRLVDEVIRSQGAECLVLEVGVFLGASVLRWLEASEHCTVIGVDLWGNGWANIIRRYEREAAPWMKIVLEPLGDEVGTLVNSLESNGSLRCSLKNLERHRDRFVAVRGDFSALAADLSKHVSPTLIYLDADKSAELLQACIDHFPDATLTGDDWNWGAELGFPTRAAVNDVCARHGWRVEVERSTWVIHK